MRAFRVRTLVIAMAAAVLAGCDGSPTEPQFAGVLEITPDQPSYAAGGLITFTLRNISPLAVQYATCSTYSVQRRSNGRWVEAPRIANFELCTQLVAVVQPGQSTIEHVLLVPDQAPGTYRVLFTGVSNSPNFVGLLDEPSAPFEVRR